MKKLLSIALAIICLIAVVPAAYAFDGATYDLAELNMTIDVPADWITFTRDIDENDPNLALFGTTAEAMMSDYESKSIYLNAVCLEPISEIVITMVSDDASKDIFDFSTIPDADMPETVETIKDEMQKLMGDAATYTETGTYTHAQAKFAVFNFETGGEMPDHAQQYTTIINGQTINITLHSYAGELTAEQEQLIKEVMGSVTFAKVTKKPGLNLQSVMKSAFTYSIAGSIILVVVLLIYKRRRQKDEAAAANTYPYNTTQPNPGNPPYPEGQQYLDNSQHHSDPSDEGSQRQP